MVKKYIYVLSFFLMHSSFAIDGTITVLEAPIFLKPTETSKVVQYYRKGQTIFLHSQEAFVDRYAPHNLDIVDEIKADQNDTNDLLIGHKYIYYPDPDSKFYLTISRNGNPAYILKEHVIIEFKDKREFTRKIIEHDNTDYRIQEPLSKNYPLIQESGYRGLTQVALGQPNYKSYPYRTSIIDTEYDLLKEYSFIWSRAEEINKDRKFFFGVMAGVHFSAIKYLLVDHRSTAEALRLYVGPYASYDVYRTKKNAINIYTSTQVYLVDQLKISTQSSIDSGFEQRVYKSNLGISQVIGFNYQFFQAFFDFDIVTGTNIRGNLPKSYTATTTANNGDFWQSQSKNDSFESPFATEVSLYLALQSYY